MTPDEVLAERAAETLDEHPDPAVAALQKCKPAGHVQTVVEAGPGHAVDETTVRYIGTLECRNPDPAQPGWGALIQPAGKAQGMQLFPDAVAKLAHDLRVSAGECGPGQCVGLQHTVKEAFTTWRALSPDSARAIAHDLKVLLP